LKLDRQFSLGKISLTAFFYVQNLFNRKNIQHVYWQTGTTSEDGSFTYYPGLKQFYLNSVGTEFFELYDLINLQHRQHYQIKQGGDLFGRPREIRFGLQIGL
jgi:hypothetical protein